MQPHLKMISIIGKPLKLFSFWRLLHTIRGRCCGQRWWSSAVCWHWSTISTRLNGEGKRSMKQMMMYQWKISINSVNSDKMDIEYRKEYPNFIMCLKLYTNAQVRQHGIEAIGIFTEA